MREEYNSILCEEYNTVLPTPTEADTDISVKPKYRPKGRSDQK